MWFAPGLIDLHKLRPISDPNVRPLINVRARYIEAWNQWQQGGGSSANAESQREALLEEMAKERKDPKFDQKMLKEGF